MNSKISLIMRYWGLGSVFFFWLLIASLNKFIPSQVPSRLKYVPTDFAQYYMGGAAVRYGMEDCLYPDSNGPSLFLTGIVKSPLVEKLQKKGWERSSVYIYPPPLAFLFIPFTFFSYSTAALLFTMLNSGAVLMSLLFFQSECRRLKFSINRTNTFIVLAGCSLPMTYGLLVANTTPMIMLSVACILLGIRKGWTHIPAIAFIFTGLTKGFSAPWAPLLILMKKWRIILSGLIVSSIILIASFLTFGLNIHLDFFCRIIPESRLLYWVGDGNLGLPSLIAYLLKNDGSSTVFRFLNYIQYVAYIGVYFLFARKRSPNLTTWYLAMFLCTLIMQLFSPLCWPHYILILLPFFPFGWSLSHKYGKIIYTSGWLLAWFPIGNILKYAFKLEVLGYGRTIGYMLLGTWGVYELFIHAINPGINSEHDQTTK